MSVSACVPRMDGDLLVIHGRVIGLAAQIEDKRADVRQTRARGDRLNSFPTVPPYFGQKEEIGRRQRPPIKHQSSGNGIGSRRYQTVFRVRRGVEGEIRTGRNADLLADHAVIHDHA